MQKKERKNQKQYITVVQNIKEFSGDNKKQSNDHWVIIHIYKKATKEIKSGVTNLKLNDDGDESERAR